MTQKDKEFLIELFNTKNNNTTVFDLLFKGLSTLSMGLIVWIFSTTNQLKQDVEVIKATNEYTKQTLVFLNEFTKKPRFTLEDFKMNTTPLIEKINKNTIELNERKNFMKDIEKRLITLETKFKIR